MKLGERWSSLWYKPWSKNPRVQLDKDNSPALLSTSSQLFNDPILDASKSNDSSKSTESLKSSIQSAFSSPDAHQGHQFLGRQGGSGQNSILSTSQSQGVCLASESMSYKQSQTVSNPPNSNRTLKRSVSSEELTSSKKSRIESTIPPHVIDHEIVFTGANGKPVTYDQVHHAREPSSTNSYPGLSLLLLGYYDAEFHSKFFNAKQDCRDYIVGKLVPAVAQWVIGDMLKHKMSAVRTPQIYFEMTRSACQELRAHLGPFAFLSLAIPSIREQVYARLRSDGRMSLEIGNIRRILASEYERLVDGRERKFHRWFNYPFRPTLPLSTMPYFNPKQYPIFASEISYYSRPAAPKISRTRPIYENGGRRHDREGPHSSSENHSTKLDNNRIESTLASTVDVKPDQMEVSGTNSSLLALKEIALSCSSVEKLEEYKTMVSEKYFTLKTANGVNESQQAFYNKTLEIMDERIASLSSSEFRTNSIIQNNAGLKGSPTTNPGQSGTHSPSKPLSEASLVDAKASGKLLHSNSKVTDHVDRKVVSDAEMVSDWREWLTKLSKESQGSKDLCDYCLEKFDRMGTGEDAFIPFLSFARELYKSFVDGNLHLKAEAASRIKVLAREGR